MSRYVSRSYGYGGHYDPEEEKTSGAALTGIFFLLEITVLFSDFWYWSLLLCGSGLAIVLIKASLPCWRDHKNRQAFFTELVCAWESENFLLYVFCFPLAWILFLFFLIQVACGSQRATFSSEYREDKFHLYNSGKGEYYGMRTDTAYEWSCASVLRATESGERLCEHIDNADHEIKKTSRLAVLYATILSFLVIPINWAKSNQATDLKKENSISLVDEVFAEIEAVWESAMSHVFSKLKRFFSAIVHFFTHKLVVRKILWHLLAQPIRAVPLYVLVKIIGSRAPSYFSLVSFFNQLKNNKNKNKGAKHENQNFCIFCFNFEPIGCGSGCARHN